MKQSPPISSSSERFYRHNVDRKRCVLLSAAWRRYRNAALHEMMNVSVSEGGTSSDLGPRREPRDAPVLPETHTCSVTESHTNHFRFPRGGRKILPSAISLPSPPPVCKVQRTHTGLCSRTPSLTGLHVSARSDWQRSPKAPDSPDKQWPQLPPISLRWVASVRSFLGVCARDDCSHLFQTCSGGWAGLTWGRPHSHRAAWCRSLLSIIQPWIYQHLCSTLYTPSMPTPPCKATCDWMLLLMDSSVTPMRSDVMF